MRRATAASILTSALSFAATIAVYPDLPRDVAIHWNAAGQVDGYEPRLFGAFLLPTVSAGLLVLLAVVPRIDPLGENVEAFREYYDGFVVAFLVFLLYVQGLFLAANLPWVGEFNVSTAILPATGILFYGVGVLMSEAKRNWFIGVRTPWTLSSDEVWDRTHRLAGRLFKLSGVVALFGVFAGANAVYFVAGPAFLVSIVVTVYSYYVYRQIDGTSATATGP